MAATSQTLAPGAVLAERFRVDEAAAFAGAKPAFLGTDEQTGERVLLFDVPVELAVALRPGVGVHHGYLGTIRALVAHGDSDVLVTDWVSGNSVEAFADGAPRLTPVDAVRFALRVSEALLALHQTGAAHGFLRPASVIIEPLDRARPVLTFAPDLLEASPYRSPERGESGPPSEADDTWALAALLFRMLTGKDPPAAGFESGADLGELGVQDPALRTTLALALAADPDKRDSERPLRKQLAHWFADHAGDGSLHSSLSFAPPPPLPPESLRRPSAPPPAEDRASEAPAEVSAPPSRIRLEQRPAPSRKSRILIFAAVAAIVGLGASWVASSLKPKPVATTAAAPSGPAAPATDVSTASASAVSLGEIAVTGEGDSGGDGGSDRNASCVAGYLPDGSFRKMPDMTWLCSETDPRAGGDKLRVAVVEGAAGTITDSVRIFSRLGWYQMAAFAVVRASCCTDSKALELPEPAPTCEPLAKHLSDVAKAVVAKQPHDAALTGFDKAVRCETTAKRASVFRRGGPPQEGEAAAFAELLKSLRAP